ncbi:MAG: tRNA (adenosine(37)-N6)-threonylcarbamoyltransferase complex dimerization subunit type 1 TsaB [Candidatus Kapabacteria bacterium]|nr:tRNA (adenosine(37)-N6)-threonylcarbamoyltransferase complex dimerization subunit type 1 TsaB [Candidatus Kapabacteria bacterium]
MHSTAVANKPSYILAIETSGQSCSVALADGEQIIAEYWLDEPNIHDRMLGVLTQRLLRDTATDVTTIRAVAVSAGPGSFTGLRIGFAFAKGLCFATGSAFITVPTLDACAYATVPVAMHLPNCDIAAITPAHDNLHFLRHYSAHGEPLTDVELLPEAAIEKRLTTQTIVCGPGATAFRRGIHIPGLQRLAARFIARAAANMLAQGVTTDPTTAAPLYIEEFTPRQRIALSDTT